MALIDCPECGRQVSDAAAGCPKCGYPINPANAPAVFQRVRIVREPLSRGLTNLVAWSHYGAGVLDVIAGIALFTVWTNLDDFDAAFTTDEEIQEAFDRVLAGWGGVVLVTFVLWILTMIWCFKAYKSVAARKPEGHTWSPGWGIAAWLIPYAQYVLPKLVINEIDKMSNPDVGDPPIEWRWKTQKRLIWSDLYWITFIASLVAGIVAILAMVAAVEPDVDATAFAGSSTTIAITLLVLSRLFGGLTVATIGERLERG